MTLAQQYMNQLDDDIKSAVLGNAGTVISFRIGTEDAMYDRTFPPIGGWNTTVLQVMVQCELR
ncbi:MAG: hypothetical protein IPO78_02940 [Saprospiraceae bacterium]|nr:hypothetical protein [Saprospiraceae bacterium]MBK9720557.1 hypothetical protein [Saprospiraceae bacterium]